MILGGLAMIANFANMIGLFDGHQMAKRGNILSCISPKFAMRWKPIFCLLYSG
jgi:hypothetical protein